MSPDNRRKRLRFKKTKLKGPSPTDPRDSTSESMASDGLVDTTADDILSVSKHVSSTRLDQHTDDQKDDRSSEHLLTEIPATTQDLEQSEISRARLENDAAPEDRSQEQTLHHDPEHEREYRPISQRQKPLNDRIGELEESKHSQKPETRNDELPTNRAISEQKIDDKEDFADRHTLPAEDRESAELDQEQNVREHSDRNETAPQDTNKDKQDSEHTIDSPVAQVRDILDEIRNDRDFFLVDSRHQELDRDQTVGGEFTIQSQPETPVQELYQKQHISEKQEKTDKTIGIELIREDQHAERTEYIVQTPEPIQHDRKEKEVLADDLKLGKQEISLPITAEKDTATETRLGLESPTQILESEKQKTQPNAEKFREEESAEHAHNDPLPLVTSEVLEDRKEPELLQRDPVQRDQTVSNLVPVKEEDSRTRSQADRQPEFASPGCDVAKDLTSDTELKLNGSVRKDRLNERESETIEELIRKHDDGYLTASSVLERHANLELFELLNVPELRDFEHSSEIEPVLSKYLDLDGRQSLSISSSPVLASLDKHTPEQERIESESIQHIQTNLEQTLPSTEMESVLTPAKKGQEARFIESVTGIKSSFSHSGFEQSALLTSQESMNQLVQNFLYLEPEQALCPESMLRLLQTDDFSKWIPEEHREHPGEENRIQESLRAELPIVFAKYGLPSEHTDKTESYVRGKNYTKDSAHTLLPSKQNADRSIERSAKPGDPRSNELPCRTCKDDNFAFVLPTKIYNKLAEFAEIEPETILYLRDRYADLQNLLPETTKKDPDTKSLDDAARHARNDMIPARVVDLSARVDRAQHQIGSIMKLEKASADLPNPSNTIVRLKCDADRGSMSITGCESLGRGSVNREPGFGGPFGRSGIGGGGHLSR